jgi:hypothetical protein
MEVWGGWRTTVLVSASALFLLYTRPRLGLTNAVTGDWSRPPNFLLVDYYNYGNFNGSVFEVAAEMNNVTYNRTCCGQESAAVPGMSTASFSTMLVIAAGVQLALSAF